MMRSRWLKHVALVLAVGLLPRPCEARITAIVIGVDQYNDTTIRPLAGAVNDAVAMARALMTHCGVQPADVHLLITRSGGSSPETVPEGLAPVEPTLANIQNAFTNAKKGLGDKDALLLYFAGHGGLLGDADGRPFLVVQDTDQATRERIVGTVIKPTDLLEYLGATKAPQIVITDCCRASWGDDGRGTGAGADAADAEARRWMFAMRDATADPSASRAWLYSCSPGQVARERDGHGVFTGFLMGGLGGAAGRGDGKTTVADLFAYVVSRMEDDKLQRPESSAVGQAGTYVLVRRDAPAQQRVTLCKPTIGDRGGETKFDTIAAALAEALPGDTIRLAAGTYYEHVALRGISLVGAGPDQTVIANGPEGSPSAITAVGGGVIAGLTVLPSPGRTAMVVDGPWTLRDCTVKGGTAGVVCPPKDIGGADPTAPCKLCMERVRVSGVDGVGIWLQCAQLAVSLTGCEVADCRGTGLLCDSHVVEIRDCAFRGSQSAKCGITASGDCQLTAIDSQCMANDGGGVGFHDRASLIATRFHSSRNGRIGLCATDSAHIALTDCWLEDNGHNGVYLKDKASLEAMGLHATGNGYPNLYVQDDASARVTGGELRNSRSAGVCRDGRATLILEAVPGDDGNTCVVSGNAEGGVQVIGQADGDVRLSNTTVTDNECAGVSVKGDAVLSLEGGTCARNAAYGLYVAHDAHATVTGVAFRANQTAISATHDAVVAVNDCEFADGRQSDIACDGSCRATVSGCAFMGQVRQTPDAGAGTPPTVRSASLLVAGRSSATLEARNQFLDCDVGVAVAEWGTCTATGNEFTRGVIGISVIGSGYLSAVSNAFRGQSGIGIMALEGRQLVIRDNRLADEPTGICIGVANAELSGNVSDGTVVRLIDDRRPPKGSAAAGAVTILPGQ